MSNEMKCIGPQASHPGKFDSEASDEKKELWNREFNIYHHSYEYQIKCSNCETVNRIRTQEDNGPEYYLPVYIPCCGCGEWIEFHLPVN